MNQLASSFSLFFVSTYTKKREEKKRKKPTSLLWPLFVFFFCCSGPAYAALCSQWETRDSFQLYIRYNQEKWARIICMNGSLQALTFVSFCLFSSQQKYIWRLQSCRTFFLLLFFRYFRLIDRKIDSSTRDSTQQRSVPIIIITEARARGDACGCMELCLFGRNIYYNRHYPFSFLFRQHRRDSGYMHSSRVSDTMGRSNNVVMSRWVKRMRQQQTNRFHNCLEYIYSQKVQRLP